MNVLLLRWDTKPAAHQGDVPTPGTDTQNVFLCRTSSLQWPLAALLVGEHRFGMVALASSGQSPELGLATVAHLSRYRGSSRQHTESDLRVFFDWCAVASSRR